MSFELTETERLFANNVGQDVFVSENLEGINLGLYFPEVRTKEGNISPNGVCVYFPNKKRVYVQSYNQVKFVNKDKARINSKSPYEIILFFLKWFISKKTDKKIKELDRFNKPIFEEFIESQEIEIPKEEINFKGFKIIENKISLDD